MPEPVRAKDVSVIKSFGAVCNLPDCGYEAPQRKTYQEANDDRLDHLNSHRILAAIQEALHNG